MCVNFQQPISRLDMFTVRRNNIIYSVLSRNGNIYSILFVVIINLTHSAKTQDICVNPNGHQGECKPLSTCPLLYDMIQRKPLTPEIRSFLRQSQCGYMGMDPLVCCVQQILPGRDTCGPWSAKLVDRVVGGTETEIDDYPWLALIGYTRPDGSIGFYCGGTLINDRYVLSAAHCNIGRSIPTGYKAVSVRLGEYNRTSGIDCMNGVCNDDPVDIQIMETINHPLYNPPQSQVNDISLYRLAEKVTFTRWIQPICLPSISKMVSQKQYVGESLIVAGWGRTETSAGSAIKLHLEVPVVDIQQCIDKYRTMNMTLQRSQMCAGGKKGEDACQGDSGGPLMALEMENGRNNWFLVAVVSFGPSPCGTKGWPAVYTPVAYHMDWVLQNIKP